MVRIGISVEGLTEELFVKQVLFPHFFERGISVTPIQVGGNVSVDRIGKELTRLTRSFNYVTTLYDFYGFKRKTDSETKGSLEERIAKSIKTDYQDVLIPYVQMYEFEGLLFSSPSAIASVLQDEGLESWAGSVLAQFDNDPEMINDSRETVPSKRLIDQSSYRKKTHGPAIAAHIGLESLREKCAGFGDWITRLEGLVHGPGK
ncbi:MAG: DUF4276 family protein [Candidatus Thiodiazotropha sp. (ex Rostrolucina anterorostrata)]|nr:DUF4276 family protein [Candidatus Thiodiazotropha sp. (ex Rostrolucina anterorostrata)]